MLSCAVYTTIMKYTAPKFFKYRPVKRSEMINLFLVSLIFIVNIILSNSSLKYNSLALDQVLFDSNHLFVDVPLCHASFHLYFGIHPLGIYLSLIPVIIGTMLVCAGDVYGTFFGIALLVISCTVSSLKGIITKYLLSGKEPLSTFHLLNIVCSLSFVDT